jgi:hypothetical protein
MLDLDANNYQLTYSSQTMTITITGTANFQVQFGTSPNAATGCWRELGFLQQDTTPNTTIVSPNVVNLSRPYEILLNIPELYSLYWSTYKNDRAAFIIPINAPSGQMIYYETKQTFCQSLYYPGGTTISNLTVTLFHTGGEQMLLNGSEWSFTLELEF